MRMGFKRKVQREMVGPAELRNHVEKEAGQHLSIDGMWQDLEYVVEGS